MTKQKHAKAIDASSKAEELLPLEQMMSQGGAFTEGAAFAVGDTNQVKASEHQGTEGEDAALLPKLSSGWKWVQLKDLGEIITGTTPPMLAERRLLGEIPLITPAEISGSFNGIEAKRWFLQENRDKAKTVPSDSILMVCIGSGGVGRCSLVDREVGFNQQINAIIVDKSLASPPFVLAAFMSLLFKVQLNSKTNCTSIPILNLKTWGELYVPLTSLVKQQRIGALFKELDHNIELNCGLLEKLTQLKKSMLEQMFPREGESVPRLRFAGFTEPWTICKLGDLGQAISGIGFPESAQGGMEGIPFFKVSDMNLEGNESVMHYANNYVSYELVAKSKWKPIEGPAVIFVRDGAAVLLNRKRLILSKCLMDHHIMHYCLDESVWNPFFALAIFEGIDLTALVRTSVTPSYGAAEVEAIVVKVPNLAEQQRIGAFFKALDQRIAQQRAKLEKLGQLKKALLEQMFV